MKMKEMKYFVELIKILRKVDKKFLYTTMGETFAFAVLPFMQLLLTRQSIRYLTQGGAFGYYFVLISVLLLLLLAMEIVNVKLNTHNNIKGNLIGQKMYTKIFEKCLYMDYEKLQRKEIQDQKEMATKAFAGGSLAQLIMYFKTIVGNVIIILGVVGVAAFADWKLMLLSIGIVALNGAQILRAKKVQYNADKEMNH